MRGLGRRASGRNHEDLLNEAIADTLDPEKRRWNKQVSFVTHLIGAMRSIASHWKEQFDADEPRLESEVVRTSEEGEPLSPLDLVGSDAPDAERAVEARQELEQIGKLIESGTVKPVVTQVFPLADAAKAHELSQTHHVRGKIVLRVVDGAGEATAPTP